MVAGQTLYVIGCRASWCLSDCMHFALLQRSLTTMCSSCDEARVEVPLWTLCMTLQRQIGLEDFGSEGVCEAIVLSPAAG